MVEEHGWATVMPRIITITIPDHQNVNEVDRVLDEFQSELGHVCGDDTWTDRIEFDRFQ